jgi:adenylate cyclase
VRERSDLPGDPAGDPAGGRAALPLLWRLNPFLVLDLVMRNLVPGYREPRPGSGGCGTCSGGVRQALPEQLPVHTRAEAAEQVGLDAEDLGRLWRALGFAEPADDEPGFSDADVQVIAEVAALAEEGTVDVDQVIRMVRPMGHLVSRLGAAQVSALSGLSAGPAGREAASGRDPVGATVDRLVPLLEDLVVHAWHRHLASAASAALPIRPPTDASGPRAVGFIDITSYTALSRRIPWADLALLLDRFEGCVFDEVAAAGGQVVKTLGDEVLFMAREPSAAAETVLSVMDAARADPTLPAIHAGLAYGPVLERAGDVFGPTVNVASRVTDLAHAGVALVDGEFRQVIAGDPRFCTQRRPRRPRRRYGGLVAYRLSRAGPG